MATNAVIGNSRLEQAKDRCSGLVPEGASEGHFNQVVNHLAGFLQGALTNPSEPFVNQQLTFPKDENGDFGVWGDLATQLHWILSAINAKDTAWLKTKRNEDGPLKKVIDFTENLTGCFVENGIKKEGVTTFVLTNPGFSEQPQQSYSDGTNHSAGIPDDTSAPAQGTPHHSVSSVDGEYAVHSLIERDVEAAQKNLKTILSIDPSLYKEDDMFISSQGIRKMQAEIEEVYKSLEKINTR